MDGLLEFVFEGISPDQLARIVIDSAMQTENVSEATRDGDDFPVESVLDPLYWSGVASADVSVACTINLRVLKVGDKFVKNATLQVIHYEKTNDMSMLLASTDCKSANIATAAELHQWAKSASERYQILNFYGGLEPAFDENTQLFHKNKVGPILEL